MQALAVSEGVSSRDFDLRKPTPESARSDAIALRETKWRIGRDHILEISSGSR
jgi:hypothetical protein